MKTHKIGRSQQEKPKNPPMKPTRVDGMKKRNPIMGTMPGWKAPKMTGKGRK